MTDRMAAVRIRTSAGEHSYSAVGKGPVDATIQAIGQCISDDITFVDMEMHALSGGEGASAEAVITVERAGREFRGTATHHDIVMAAGLAYVAACNAAGLKAESLESEEVSVH
jgi:2-isopropylmalate synthase